MSDVSLSERFRIESVSKKIVTNIDYNHKFSTCVISSFNEKLQLSIKSKNVKYVTRSFSLLFVITTAISNPLGLFKY